jgi:hypothetical protein
MPGRRPLALGTAGALVVVALAARANAQQNGDSGAAAAAPAPAAAAPAANAGGGAAPAPSTTPAPAPDTGGTAATVPALPAPVAAPPPVEPPPPPPPPPQRVRGKPLRTSVGLSPTAADLGSEADIVSSADMAGNSSTLMAEPTQQKFSFSMKGYLRAPLRLGWGPSLDHPMGSSVTELHSPPRIVGLGSGDWNYIALAPNPTGSLYLTAGVPNVTANVIFATNTFYDSGYKDLDQMGGISQAYVALKFPAAFGERGGLAWTMGSFSNRYGNAGPYQTSSGYYGTYLFGRTHVAGEDLTVNFDITDHLEIALEDGVGAKIEVPPFLIPNAAMPKNNFIPGQGSIPNGSNFVHHAHVGFFYDDWMKLGFHYLTSWTPSDNSNPPTMPTPESRLTVLGADLHLDREMFGSFYVGYSHIDGQNLLPLSDGVQVLHGSNGKGFKEDYFGPKDRTLYTYTNDTGTVDTILWQYLFRLAPALGYAGRGRDIALSTYGMFNHVRSPMQPGRLAPLERNVDMNKLKWGAELEVALIKFMNVGFRYDQVAPDLSNDSASYKALSPRLIFHTNWKSKEYVIVNYTHFWTGPTAYPGSPYSDVPYLVPDKDLLMVSAIMSL